MIPRKQKKPANKSRQNNCPKSFNSFALNRFTFYLNFALKMARNEKGTATKGDL